ncbi:MAG: RluA family pseudouridine synthase [Pseudomonadota bacterium]
MPQAYRPPPPQPIPVLYEDEDLLIVNKPAGLLSVPGRGPEKADCLQSRIGAQCGDVWVVHRLDMETSGLMVFARSPTLQRAMSALFEGRQIQKVYGAVVAGVLAHMSGTISLPLRADWPRRPLQRVDTVTGKASITRWARVSIGDDTTRLALYPVTGRTHQLRVHLEALGHPILGDSLYGDSASRAAADRLLLHAMRLDFVHPISQVPVTVQSDPPF